MSDNQDFWRFHEEYTKAEMQRWNDVVQSYLKLFEDSSTYWDDFSGYYDTIRDPQFPIIMILSIFLSIRDELKKEREWFENLKKNLKRFLP
ncbi:MAG: hypothetical protein JHC26_01135 [Thermofilum sp.]|uniref:hypothetical protein n=1 Tax=Thermofilum sp. TaxID=1961369 RepID=UPI00258EBE1B|nr:hypothetical protein [Thermofilum sp.]MCI4407663.1 hypothetical protein [Thermofilum sp.]